MMPNKEEIYQKLKDDEGVKVGYLTFFMIGDDYISGWCVGDTCNEIYNSFEEFWKECFIEEKD
jgi:hypothetical protein